MAVSLLAHEVSNLCLGKPTLRSLSVSTTVGEVLSVLKRSEENFLSVWCCDHSSTATTDFDDCRCIGKVCMVDIICYLCKEDNLLFPSTALKSPISVLLPGPVRHVEPHSRGTECSLIKRTPRGDTSLSLQSPEQRWGLGFTY